MYRIEFSTTFKKSYKLAMKRGRPIEKLDAVIRKLSNGETLPASNRDHALSGNMEGFRECHIQADWLLVYRIKEVLEILYLVDTGTHSDIFG